MKTLSVLTIILIGFASVVARGGDTVLRIFRSSELTDFMSGSLSGKLDRAVFDAIPKSLVMNGLAAGLLYAGLGDAGSQVWAGCGNWLYSREELRVDRHDAENILAHADILRALSKTLAEYNVLLVIVPVPDKAEQVEDRLCGIAAAQSRFRADVWQRAAKLTSVIQIDLRSGWPSPGYWHTDTHWDSRGARFAADAIAHVINMKLGAGADRVHLIEGPSHQRVGDLARLAGLADAPRWLAPSYDQETDVRAEIESSGGLLDETPSPSIVLAGSSFSMNSGFLDYLQASLSREVAQISMAGGGFAGALLDLLQNKPRVLADAKVIIWEWPMRSLTVPLTDAERRFLKQSAN